MSLKKASRAFTLVEVLLGLVIAAIIGLSIYNMFWSAMRLDDHMHHVYDRYIEVLLADQAMTHDLENAVMLDYTVSYPDAVNFEGSKESFSMITQTAKGIKRVRYFSGTANGEAAAASAIGRITNPSHPVEEQPQEMEYLLRQESSLSDWLNQASDHTTVQIVASGLAQGSFNCQYAANSKDLHTVGEKAVDYQDSWTDAKSLPLAVSCSFALNDPNHAQQALVFRRDMFLPPVPGYYNEQQ